MKLIKVLENDGKYINNLWFSNLYKGGIENGKTHTLTIGNKIYDLMDIKIQEIGGDIGNFSTPSLLDLRKNTRKIGLCTTSVIFGDVMEYIAFNHDATFQVASQFNCLEMPNNSYTPGNRKKLGLNIIINCFSKNEWSKYSNSLTMFNEN